MLEQALYDCTFMQTCADAVGDKTAHTRFNFKLFVTLFDAESQPRIIFRACD